MLKIYGIFILYIYFDFLSFYFDFGVFHFILFLSLSLKFFEKFALDKQHFLKINA
jgi:hypothetical protein